MECWRSVSLGRPSWSQAASSCLVRLNPTSAIFAQNGSIAINDGHFGRTRITVEIPARVQFGPPGSPATGDTLE